MINNNNNFNNPLSATSIRTVSGIWVNVFDPKPEMFIIEDIAHALAFQCRFGGHLPEFYSVAQHSVLCSILADKEHKFAALMHDTSEAYLLDIPRPIKGGLGNYKEIEYRVMDVIAKKFGFQFPFHKNIKEVDERMLVTEWHEVMLQDKTPFSFKCLSPLEAKNEFLEAFYKLQSIEVPQHS